MFYQPEIDSKIPARPPFKSCVVPRAIGWLSTISMDGIPNLAPFSQFTNLTFDPPFVMVSINQGPLRKRKDTTINIESQGEFVYNMVTYDLREAMNITASDFEPGIDEFEAAGLKKEASVLVKPYRVAASPVQMECLHYQTIRLPGNGPCGSCDIIIGKVVGIHVKDEYLLPDGKLDILKMRPLARLGYNDYTTVDHIFEMTPSNAAGPSDGLSSGMEGTQNYI